MVGLADGVRLYNDLHMKPVAPRLTIYLAQKDENLFHPVLLQEVTVAELIRNIAAMLEVCRKFWFYKSLSCCLLRYL